MDVVRFHFDPICPWCYQTSRWAKRVEQLGEIELDRGLFSLEVVNLKDGADPRELQARSGPALRTATLIRQRKGGAAIGPSTPRSATGSGSSRRPSRTWRPRSALRSKRSVSMSGGAMRHFRIRGPGTPSSTSTAD